MSPRIPCLHPLGLSRHRTTLSFLRLPHTVRIRCMSFPTSSRPARPSDRSIRLLLSPRHSTSQHVVGAATMNLTAMSKTYPLWLASCAHTSSGPLFETR
ncbi:hypothetical protein BD311DRAFT_762666 [Dichomitus squalens]|uniref:Uncharacterized protein n=1 Tax=Dichomitus squalens TaxID=114155 RepID=A0A4V2JZT8_9APHY|nr:hypothetical protein BD311DRAFT_762666 [Dichomitus squalens]